MAVKELVLHPDFGLAERTVVESYQKIEIPQLEQEVTTNQAAVDQAVSALTSAPVEADALVAAATTHSEAKAVLEDSKSNLETGKSLVAQLPDDGAENAAENGTGESSEDKVAEPGQEF